MTAGFSYEASVPLGLHFPGGVLQGIERWEERTPWRAAVYKTQYLCWLCLLFTAGCRLFPVDLSQDKEIPQIGGETITITKSSVTVHRSVQK